MTKMLKGLATLLIISSLMGCGMSKKEEVKEDVVGSDNEPIVEEKTEGKPSTETNHKLAVADDVAEKIVKINDVKSANVIVTDTNAYVAVVLKEGTEGTKQIEDKIADEARAANANFKNVYVSLNPDFVKEMNDYGTKIRANEPVEGFFTEFSDAVKRVFPDAH